MPKGKASAKDHKRIWRISNITSAVLLLVLIILWTMINQRGVHSTNKISTVSDINQSFLHFEQKYVNKKHKKDYLRVPTGLFIQSYEFVETNTVKVSGYVWQKIDKKLLKDKFEPGIIFPDAKSIASMEKEYEYREGDYVLMGWRFYGVSLLQNFDYSDYPFDILTIQIHLWPKDFYHYVLLEPDLSSYISTKSGIVFGVEDDIVKQGFGIKESYFDLINEKYDTTFGSHLAEYDTHFWSYFLI